MSARSRRLELRTLQHFNVIVEDYDAACRHFGDALGARLNYEVPSASLSEGVEASLWSLGPVLFELVGAKRGSTAGLRRLLERGGPGYIGIEFCVDELGTTKRTMADHGIRIKYDHDRFFVTDPRDLFGLTIECFDGDWYAPVPPDPTMVPVAPPEYWRDEHPIGIQEVESFSVAVNNREAATQRWAELVCADGDNHRLRAASTWMRLVDASTDEDVSQFLSRHGPGIYSVTFSVVDIDRTATWLQSRLEVELDRTHDRTIIPASGNHGCRMEFVSSVP